MGKFKVGVVGCGRIASVYSEALKDLEKKGIVQVCVAVDKNIEYAQKFAKDFLFCTAENSLQSVLESDIDAVHILTPHFLHAEQAVACLESGKHVLCEKPIAISVEDANRMAAAAKSNKCQLGIIFQNRYIKGIQVAKRLIENGSMGEIKSAWSSLHWWRPQSYYQCDWKGLWEKEGGGVVIDQAIHSIDLVRCLFGCEVTSVKGNIDRRVLTNIEVEDVADAAITFENGAIYSFFACNYNTLNDPVQIKIICSKGTMHLTGSTVIIENEQSGRKEYLPDAGNSNETHYWGYEHATQIADFYNSLSKGTPVSFSAHDATKTLEVVLAIYQSSFTGKTCKVPEDVPLKTLKYLC